MSRMNSLSPSQFHGVHNNDIPIVEDLLLLNFLLYDNHSVEGNIIGELVRRSVQKHENFVRLFRYNNHICYVSNLTQSSNPIVGLIVAVSLTVHPICNDI